MSRLDNRSMRVLLTLLLFGLAALLPNTIRAQADEPAPIAPGLALEGQLGEDAISAAYTFVASAGDSAIITVTTRRFIPHLTLLDADGAPLVEVDGLGLSAQISQDLPADGVYTVIVSSQRAHRSGGEFFSTGDFTLQLEIVAAEEAVDEPPSTVDPDDDSLIPGALERGHLTAENPAQEYPLRVEEGEVVSITLTADTFDAFLVLLDPSGTPIAEDDDSAGGLNARIGPLEMPVSGVYTVVVTSFGHYQSSQPEAGSYRLQVDAVPAEPIAFGADVEGQISERSPRGVYRFRTDENDVVMVTLTTSNPAVFMRLTGPGTALESFGGNGTIGPLITRDDTGYVVVVSGDAPFFPVPYTLRVERIAPQVMQYDEATVFDFDGVTARYFLFEGGAGDVLDLRVDSGGSVDTLLTIIDANGYPIASDDDSGSGFDPEINSLMLLDDGMYSVLVQPYIPGDDGLVTLSLQNPGTPSLDEGPQRVRISDKQLQTKVEFEGVLGETVLLHIDVVVGSSAEPRVSVVQDGETLAANSVGQVQRLTLGFDVPLSGPVTVIVEDLGGNPAIFDLSIEREGPATRG